MYKSVYAKSNEGLDSFIRLTSTLRRREINIHSIKMETDYNNELVIEIIIDENTTSLENVLNHMYKLHDLDDIRVLKNDNSKYA